jgi:hypothetical protein
MVFQHNGETTMLPPPPAPKKRVKLKNVAVGALKLFLRLL